MKQNILFVDDEPNFLDGVRRMLRNHRQDWEMHFVQGVDQAMDFLQTTPCDLIVSDIQMPGKSGFDLLDILRQHPSAVNRIPVVILTGNAETDMKRRALDLGATDLLNKPVHQEDLVARIRSVLRLKWHQDQLEKQNKTLEQKVRERTLDLERSRHDIILRLAKAGEYRDEDTGDHVIRVASCCRLLAEAMGLSDDQVRSIFLTSPLHDIGKIGISDTILLKPGKLTPEEWVIMKTHAAIGAAILRDAPKGLELLLLNQDVPRAESVVAVDPLRESAAEIALCHHEKWDGSGYPLGLRGDAIPVAAQIVAVTDVYDALRSDRPYKKGFEIAKTLAIMEEGAGRHFSPAAYEAFVRVQPEFEEIRLCYSN